MKNRVLWTAWLLFVALGVAWPIRAAKSGDLPNGPRENRRPHVVLVSYDEEYHSAETLPRFARQLHDRYACDCSLLVGEKEKGIVGLEKLATADALVLFVWRYPLPKQQMAMIRRYLDAGKPLVAMRTSCHAFDVKTEIPAGWESWPRFGRDVIGSNYRGHHRHDILTTITAADRAAAHPILTGIPLEHWTSAATLYQVSPLDPSASALLVGRCVDGTEPIAWTRNYHGGRVFYTSLGSIDDFKTPQFCTMLVNAIYWAMDKPPPKNVESRN